MVTLTLALGVNLELVRIPAGEFWMGAELQSYKESPRHRLTLPEYWMGKYTVTVAQYAAFVQAAGYSTRLGQLDHQSDRPDYPVIYVTWYDAQAFCRWINENFLAGHPELAGCQARLPGEAEWEKAARGPDGREYPWGSENPDETRCNFDKDMWEITPVGQYSPLGDSPYGCADMSGNVWEWTHSLNIPYPYRLDDGRENEHADGERVVRGGAAYSFVGVMRGTYRAENKPDKFFATRGFRMCVSPIYL